jgi:hypothetical protein
MSDARLERICRAIALVASVGFALAAGWEIADTFGAGHFASSSAVCTGGENVFRWGIVGAVPKQLFQPPAPNDFYCHHPWGIFWVSALFIKVFGHASWACRLPAVLQSVLTVPALYYGVRALWGPIAGAVAALCFAVTPIALSFAGFNSLEVPVIFGTVLVIWGYARYRESYRRRFAALALFGLFHALMSDWPATVFAAVQLGAVFVAVFLLRRLTAPADRRRIGTFWGLAVLGSAAILGFHVLAFAHLGQLNELFASGSTRSTGSQLPLAEVLRARKFWIEVSFTGLAIAIGKLALPVLALRPLVRRSEVEVLPLAVFAMAAVQYVVFKQGADIHIFWPHYFALYFALACAGLVRTALEAAEYWAKRPIWLAPALLGLGCLPALLILPDGLRALGYAHRSGGRFNENGHLIKPDKDKVAALEWLTQRMAPDTGVILHPGMRQSLWVDWSLRRAVSTVNRLPSGTRGPRERNYVADLRFMSADEQDVLARDFSFTVVGPYVAVDRDAGPRELDAFAIENVEPTLLGAYFRSSSHAQRRIAADPYLTWEMRDRFELLPNEPPSTPPVSFEQMRIAHNIAVARGDAAQAERWLGALLASTDRSRAQRFTGEHELLATRLERGTSLVLDVYFRAGGPDPLEPELFMTSQVAAAPALSLVPRDEKLAKVGMPFAIPSSRWKRGYVYVSRSEVIRRIGSERWLAAFHSPREFGDELELLRLP